MLIRFPLIIVRRSHRSCSAPRRRRSRPGRARTCDSRSRHHPRHPRRHRPADFTADCNYTMRLTTQVNLPKMKEGGLDASFFIVYVGQGELTPRRIRCGLSSGDREVRRHPPAHRTDRAEGDRARADPGRRAAHRQEREEGRDDRRRERLPDWHRSQAREGVLRLRRPLHVGRAQRPQPARRLAHRRGGQRMEMGRPVASRTTGRRGDESAGDDGGCLASIEGDDAAADRHVAGAGDRLALLDSASGESDAQHGRRDADGDEDQRRCRADQSPSPNSSRPIRRERAPAIAALRTEFGLSNGGGGGTTGARGAAPAAFRCPVEGARRPRPQDEADADRPDPSPCRQIGAPSTTAAWRRSIASFRPPAARP